MGQPVIPGQVQGGWGCEGEAASPNVFWITMIPYSSDEIAVTTSGRIPPTRLSQAKSSHRLRYSSITSRATIEAPHPSLPTSKPYKIHRSSHSVPRSVQDSRSSPSIPSHGPISHQGIRGSQARWPTPRSKIGSSLHPSLPPERLKK